jgi:hypothetical protein
MAEEVGMDNIFIFGMTVDQVEDLRRKGLELNFLFLSLFISI